MKSPQNQTPSSPARVSYFGSLVGSFMGASLATAPFATFAHHSYPCDCSTSVSNLITLPCFGSESLTQKVVRPSTVCQPVGVASPASKSPLGTRFFPSVSFGGLSGSAAAASP